jgi:hypothetical protein
MYSKVDVARNYVNERIRVERIGRAKNVSDKLNRKMNLRKGEEVYRRHIKDLLI